MKAGSSHADVSRPTAIIASRVNRFSRQAFRAMKVISPMVTARNTTSKTWAATHDGELWSRYDVIDSTCPRLTHLTKVETSQRSRSAPADANTHVTAPRDVVLNRW